MPARSPRHGSLVENAGISALSDVKAAAEDCPKRPHGASPFGNRGHASGPGFAPTARSAVLQQPDLDDHELAARNGRRLETVPERIVEDAFARLAAILE